jgi:hypothetical protein
MNDSHPLLSAKLLAVLALLGVLWGSGMALILADRLALLGVGMGFIASGCIFWLYGKSLKLAVKTGLWTGPEMPSKPELVIAVMCAIGAPLISAYLYLLPVTSQPVEVATQAKIQPATPKSQQQALVASPPSNLMTPPSPPKLLVPNPTNAPIVEKHKATTPTTRKPIAEPITQGPMVSPASGSQPQPTTIQSLPRSGTDLFMKVLRDWYIQTQKDVPAEIVNGTAWEPEDWINQQLEDYERPWRVKINGSDYVATPISLPVPSAGVVTTYSQGNAVTHRFPETVRRAFLQALVPPKKLGLIFVYTDGDEYYHEKPQLPWEDWAEEIKSLFPMHGGGWTIDRSAIYRVHDFFRGTITNGYLEDNYSGWVIQLRDPQNPTADEKTIMAAFTAAAIPYTIALEKPDDVGMDGGVFYIAFGKKAR